MLDGRFRFDNYVVGASNRLAASAARAVADMPGAVYNPLVVYSASGLGKTHLLTALGNAVREAHPDLTVEYNTLEEFVERLLATVQAGQAADFSRQYQDVDVLLLDDVQFLTGRAETQNEILRLVNAAQNSGRQIVLACDRPPAEIPDVDQRLLTRLSGGLTVDIGVPEFETRVAILRHKCAERGLTLSASMLEEIASPAASNVRELQGALNRAIAQQALQDPADSLSSDVIAELEAPASSLPDEYETFVNELADALTETVDNWRVRIGEAITRWSGEGYRVDVFQRALDGTEKPDVDGLEARFAAAASRLRALEAEAVRLDQHLAGLEAFRDPERLAEAEAIVQRALVAYDPPPAPDPRLTIQTFIPGQRNQVALRAAGEVIAMPGKRYNPLFVHGAAGTGKTHLLHAIGNSLAARENGSWTVARVSAAEFTDELISALHEGTIERWRLRYRAVDALVMDDVQALAGKERSQEELFNLFNALHDAGRQIVLAAKVFPAGLLGLAPRLRSRFDGGLVVELGRVPEAERVARYTPVHIGDEAAAPTIDAWFEDKQGFDGHRYISPAAVDANAEVDTFFLDPEKCVIEWPVIEGRVVEDPR